MGLNENVGDPDSPVLAERFNLGHDPVDIAEPGRQHDLCGFHRGFAKVKRYLAGNWKFDFVYDQPLFLKEIYKLLKVHEPQMLDNAPMVLAIQRIEVRDFHDHCCEVFQDPPHLSDESTNVSYIFYHIVTGDDIEKGGWEIRGMQFATIGVITLELEASGPRIHAACLYARLEARVDERPVLRSHVKKG